MSFLIFGSHVDLPSNRRCDLRQGTLCSVRWKHCHDEFVSANVWRCHECRTRLWGVGECGLNAQCLRRERFFRVNSCGSKRRFEGIWTDVSCIFDRTFALISISENWIPIVEHDDCSPFDKLLGSGKRLVIRDSEICVFEMFGVFVIQTRWHRHSCDWGLMWCGQCCMFCVFSSIFDHSSASALRRCNRCVDKLQPLGRKHLRRGVVGKIRRCRAGELLWSCAVLLLAACKTFRNKMWPVVQFDSSNMSRSVQFQLQSGYQVLPPCRRWDLCL